MTCRGRCRQKIRQWRRHGCQAVQKCHRLAGRMPWGTVARWHRKRWRPRWVAGRRRDPGGGGRIRDMARAIRSLYHSGYGCICQCLPLRWKLGSHERKQDLLQVRNNVVVITTSCVKAYRYVVSQRKSVLHVRVCLPLRGIVSLMV